MDEKAPDQFIHFSCNFCGRHLRVSKSLAGKAAKCPQCHNPVVIPDLAVPKSADEDELIRLRRDFEMPPQPDRPIYNAPAQHRMAPEPDSDVPPAITPPLEYKPATLYDVILFPWSLAGILHLLLFWLLPFFFAASLPFTMVAIRVGAAYNCLSFLLYAYLYYYLSNCVIAAAKDQRRAPDVSLEDVLTISDLLQRLILLLSAAGICFLPMSAYYLYFYIADGVSKIDTVYWLLFGLGIFFFPMFLLAALMFDSYTAFNPLLIIGSIFSTFLPYCGLIFLFALCVFLMYFSWSLPGGWSFFSWGIDIYLMFGVAYILGRFLLRYEDRLNWEIKL